MQDINQHSSNISTGGVPKEQYVLIAQCAARSLIKGTATYSNKYTSAFHTGAVLPGAGCWTVHLSRGGAAGFVAFQRKTSVPAGEHHY
jgi:hypothetical protein